VHQGNRVNIDGMQFVFSPGKDGTDAIFIGMQVQERYLLLKKELWLAYKWIWKKHLYLCMYRAFDIVLW